jgi:hypothetical protein
VEAGRPTGPEILERLRLAMELAEETRRQAEEVVAMSKQLCQGYGDGNGPG